MTMFVEEVAEADRVVSTGRWRVNYASYLFHPGVRFDFQEAGGPCVLFYRSTLSNKSRLLLPMGSRTPTYVCKRTYLDLGFRIHG